MTSSSGHTSRSGVHGSGIGIDAAGRGNAAGDESPRGREVDVGADAVGATTGGAEDGGQLLREPALHPPRGDRNDLALERIAQRLSEDLAEGLNECVCAVGAVDVQHTDSFASRQRSGAGRPQMFLEVNEVARSVPARLGAAVGIGLGGR